MDLTKLAGESLEKLVASGKIEETIEKRLAKTIDEIVSDALSRYSPFGKQLEEAVRGSLALKDPKDLPSYNDALIKVIRAQVDGRINATIQQQVAANLTELLQPPPEKVKLSELVAAYIQHVKDHRSGGCVCHGDSERITLHVEEKDSYGAKWREIALDGEPDRRPDDCEVRISVRNDEVHGLRVKWYGDPGRQMFAENLYGFHRAVFYMRVAKTKLVWDVEPDEIETSYSMAAHD